MNKLLVALFAGAIALGSVTAMADDDRVQAAWARTRRSKRIDRVLWLRMRTILPPRLKNRRRSKSALIRPCWRPRRPAMNSQRLIYAVGV